MKHSPEAIERKTQRRRTGWFDNYLQAILYRDVRELANIEQLTELPNLLSLIAHRSGNLLNLAELSRTSDVSQTTLKRYFTLLETLFLVYRFPAWARNPSKRLVKASSTVDGKDFKGLRHLQETEAKVFQRGIVLYSGREVIPFGEKLFAVPLSMWWAS